MAYTLKVSEEEIARYRQMAETAHAEEGDAWRAAGFVPGARVADVGCGPGLTLCRLATAVAPNGEAVGVEGNAETAETATEILKREGITNARVVTADAEATGLDPGSFDAVMIRHVLAHNGGREQSIVDHAASLVKPGGHVYVVDTDVTAVRSVPSADDLEDLHDRYLQLHAKLGNDLSVGLRLAHLLDAAGLEVIDRGGRYHAIERNRGVRGPAWAARDALIENGLATEGDFARWSAALERDAAVPGLKLMYVPVFRAIGRRPTD
jgi:ubiquinone/menaquinone biosynthesis C-methylase UbiE